MKEKRRNLTLSLPADLIRNAKILAAKRQTSVNALVKENLGKMIQAEDEYHAAGQRILAAAEKGLYRIRRAKWKRSELYE